MAKASEADINMAMTLANYCDAIEDGQMPDALSEDPDSTEFLDYDDREQYARLLDGIRLLLRTGSIFRVVLGMAVVCDPSNECLDPNADTIEHHPKRQLLEQQRDEWLALLERASASLGSFVSDEGWSQKDMDTMDSIDAAIARANAGLAAETTKAL